MNEPQRVTVEWVAKAIAGHLSENVLRPGVGHSGVVGPIDGAIYVFLGGGEILMVQVSRAEIVMR